MEPVQYKGYTIVIKHYAAFRHKRREYPEIFDYVILTGWNVEVSKGYGFNSLEETIGEARRSIDRIILPLTMA